MIWDGHSRQIGNLFTIQYAIGLVGSAPSTLQEFGMDMSYTKGGWTHVKLHGMGWTRLG